MDQGAELRATKRWPKGLRAIGIAAWVAVCAAGLAGLADAASAPGKPAAQAPRRWPGASKITRVPGRPTLLMFAHTKCACTRASVRELERILARSGKRFDAHVVFSGPRGDDGFLSLRAAARSIPGLAIVDDDAEALRFGALTSGQVLVYDGKGDLVFRGGLTPSRGHEGETVGHHAVLSLVLENQNSDDKAQSSDVFGCALFRDQGNP